MLDDKNIFDPEEMMLKALREEPDYKLPENFASLMAEKMERRFAWSQYIREFLIYLAAILGVVAVYAAMAFIWFDTDWKNWLDLLRSNAVVVAGILLLSVFILFADRVLLRYFLFKTSPDRHELII